MIQSFFKLIRWPNLLVIAVSMIFIRYFVIFPGLHLSPEDGMSLLAFFLLITATLFIAVGGYLINDLSDSDADNFNKPGKNQIGQFFSAETVLKIYWFFTGIGVIAGSWLSFLVGHANFSLIFLLTAGLLWFYAKRYQCQPLVGNLVVAFLSALSFGLVWLFDFISVLPQAHHLESFKSYFVLTNNKVLIYMAFAFLISLSREMVKDMEDYQGDDRFGCRTFCVVYGLGAAKKLTMSLLAAGLLFSGWAQYYFFQHHLTSLYLFFYAIDLLFVINGIRLMKAKQKSDYAALSTQLKIVMAAGILSMLFCSTNLFHVV